MFAPQTFEECCLASCDCCVEYEDGRTKSVTGEDCIRRKLLQKKKRF